MICNCSPIQNWSTFASIPWPKTLPGWMRGGLLLAGLALVPSVAEAADPTLVSLTPDCAATRDFAIDEITGAVYGFSWIASSACVVGTGRVFESTDPVDPINGPQAIAVDSSRRRLYANSNSGLLVFDVDSGSLLETIPLQGTPQRIVVDPLTGRVYGDNVVVDPATHSQVGRINGISPVVSNLAVDPTRRRLVVAQGEIYGLCSLQIVDLEPASPHYEQIVQEIPIYLSAYSGAIGVYFDHINIAFSRDTGRVYVVLNSGNPMANYPISVFDLVDGQYVLTALWAISDVVGRPADSRLGPSAIRVAFDDSRNRLYVRAGDYYSLSGEIDGLYALEGTSGVVLSSTQLSPDAFNRYGGLSVSPVTQEIYLGLGVFDEGDSRPGLETLVFVNSEPVSVATPAGSLGATVPGVSVGFGAVNVGGVTTVSPLDPTTLSLSAPGQFSFQNAVAYEIATTAQAVGPFRVCVTTGISSPTVFDSISLLHAENGAWVDRTVSRDYATGTVCAVTNSLSPFILARRTAPSITLKLLSDESKVYRQGSTVPLKVQIWSDGQNVSSPSRVVSAVELRWSSNATVGPVTDSGNANPDSNFRFDATIGVGAGYIFNMSTKSLGVGKYELRIKTGEDPTVLVTTIQLR